MTIEKTFRISRLHLDPETNKIRVVVYAVDFVDPSTPDIKSTHVAEVLVGGDLGILRSTPEENLLDAARLHFESRAASVEAFHAEQIEVRQITERLIPVSTSFVSAWTDGDVNEERERRIAVGCTVDVTDYGPVPLQGNIADQINLFALAFGSTLRIAQGDVTTTKVFRDALNAEHLLTPPQLLEVWTKGTGWIEGIYKASWDIKALPAIPDDFKDDSYWAA